MVRAFLSELLKLRRWSVLASGAVMIVATAGVAYKTYHTITGGFTGPEVGPLIAALPTTRGLVTIIITTQALIIVVALTIVTANLAAEWSQGTLRNLLVREPGRLRLLSGKMLALMLFVAICVTLTLLVSAAFVLVSAQSHGLSTAAWSSPQGIRIFLSFFGNELLCFAGISLFGMLIAVLTRSTGAAIGIGLAYVLGEGLLPAAWPEGAQWLPIRLFNYLVGSNVPAAVGPNPPQGYPAALLAALLWMAAFVVVSAVVFRRQDISA
jgi:ABC-2 type transport system permease protein